VVLDRSRPLQRIVLCILLEDLKHSVDVKLFAQLGWVLQLESCVRYPWFEIPYIFLYHHSCHEAMGYT